MGPGYNRNTDTEGLSGCGVWVRVSHVGGRVTPWRDSTGRSGHAVGGGSLCTVCMHCSALFKRRYYITQETGGCLLDMACTWVGTAAVSHRAILFLRWYLTCAYISCRLRFLHTASVPCSPWSHDSRTAAWRGARRLFVLRGRVTVRSVFKR